MQILHQFDYISSLLFRQYTTAAPTWLTTPWSLPLQHVLVLWCQPYSASNLLAGYTCFMPALNLNYAIGERLPTVDCHQKYQEKYQWLCSGAHKKVTRGSEAYKEGLGAGSIWFLDKNITQIETHNSFSTKPTAVRLQVPQALEVWAN